MEASCSLQVSLSPIHSSPRFLTSLSRVSLSSSSSYRTTKSFNLSSSFRVIHLRNRCSVSSIPGILVAEGSSEEDGKVVDEGDFDLRTWMHENGSPPCKVVLKERFSHHSNHKPIHYVAASEDLQVLYDRHIYLLL